MRAPRMIVVCALLAGCGESGFGVGLTLSASPALSSTELSRIKSLAFTVSGDETGTFSHAFNRPAFTNRRETAVYRPRPTSDAITIMISARDGNDGVIAEGTTGKIALVSGALVDRDVSLVAAVATADMSGASDLGAAADLSGGDLSVGVDAAPDLAGVSDLASASDLAKASDLAIGPDMKCGATVENCFNGIDDDCNGKVDCEDPACNTVAVCVPEVAGASYGTVLSGSPLPSCPQAKATERFLYGDFASGSCGGCTSTLSGSASVNLYESDENCFGTNTAVSTTACTSQVNMPTAQIYGKATMTCSAPSGTVKYTAGTDLEDAFCVSASVGAGCPSGQVCAPSVGAHQTCVMIDAADACPTGYGTAVSPSSGNWYTSTTNTQTCPSCASVQAVGVTLVSLCSTDICSPSCAVDAVKTTCEFAPSITAGTLYFAGITSATCTVPILPSGSVAGSGSQEKVCCQ